jgi:hypothetical protein
MVFRAGLRDPCTKDVAKLSESVKILEPHPSACMDHDPKCMQDSLILHGY